MTAALRINPAPRSLPDSAPRTLAAAFIEARFTDGRHFRDEFFERTPAAFRPVVREVLRADMAEFLSEQWIDDGQGKSHQYKPNARRTSDALDALANLCQVRCDRMPAWLDDARLRPDPQNIIAFPNGLLDVAEYVAGRVRLMAPTPAWFSANALPFRFDENAPEPKRWWDFLCSGWEDDAASVELLGEWAGYCLTPDTRQQKILLMAGPPRSGKGTVARILTRMIGPENIAAPTLAGLATNFGPSALVGKQLAIISDARLSGRTDQAIVVERLLSISGEDSLTIDRKHREPMTIRLPTRLMILSNELPKLADASGALSERFLILILRKSHLGNEDVDLTDKLATEMPGILLWALAGLRRLHARGRFAMPESSVQAIEELRDLVSPIQAFVRERCIIGAGRSVSASRLYEAWAAWSRDQGREHAGTVQTFGRDLRAALPSVEITRPRQGQDRTRTYQGIDLEPVWSAMVRGPD